MKTNYWQKLESNVIYHIYNRAIGKDNLFISNGNYEFFLNKWKIYLPYLDVFAFCLMPNHFHFLVKVKPLSCELKEHVLAQRTMKNKQLQNDKILYFTYLEDQFKRLLSCYALTFNKQQDRHGSLFQKRFKRVSVNDEYKLQYLLAYIHHNPIHHQFCKNFNEWKYSSWMAYQNLNQPSQVNREVVFDWFGDDIEKAVARFKEYHEGFKIDYKLYNNTLEED